MLGGRARLGVGCGVAHGLGAARRAARAYASRRERGRHRLARTIVLAFLGAWAMMARKSSTSLSSKMGVSVLESSEAGSTLKSLIVSSAVEVAVARALRDKAHTASTGTVE